MSTSQTTTPAARRLMVACCVVLALHVLAALYFTLLPDSYLHRRRIALWYREHMLPGPFYRDDQLEASYHARIRYYTHGRWTEPRDYSDEAFQTYHRQPWRYDALKQADYIQGLLGAAYREYRYDKTRAVLLQPAWRTLQHYIANQWQPAGPIDSVNIRYVAFGRTRQPGKSMFLAMMDVTYTPKQHATP